MRCTYLIQSHTQPALLARLVTTLRSASDAAILVVHDASRVPLDETVLAGTGAIVIQRRAPVRRGRFSCLEPYLEGVAHLLAAGEPFDWLVYLSGQDYPVRPVSAIESDLSGGRADAFLAHWDIASPDSPWPLRRARRRYFHQYAELPDRLTPFLRLLHPVEALTPLQLYLTYGALVGWPARRTPFSESFRCFGGSMWHALSVACVAYLAAELERRPELVSYYRRTVVPDESLVPTVLANHASFRIVADNRRFADVDEQPGGHARVLGPADLEELTSGRYDFARRFDLDASAALLDALDERCGRGRR
ncbi:MAG: core-2/I-branching enzyme [Acidobacteria bacterium]|nr:core-2/I-branching enzyme [Acidobacteriota bacterium]